MKSYLFTQENDNLITMTSDETNLNPDKLSSVDVIYVKILREKLLQLYACILGE